MMAEARSLEQRCPHATTHVVIIEIPAFAVRED